MGGGVQVALVALLLLLVIVPPVDAEHCATGIVVYGRPAFTPGVIVPPTPRICLAVETSGSAGHVLPPGTEEIFVRVQANIGVSYPLLTLRLQGLGFHEHSYPLTRAQTPTGTWVYDVADWLDIPNDNAQGTLRAKVRFPGNYDAYADYVLLGVPDPSTLLTEPGPP